VIPFDQRPVLALQRRFEPPLDVEQDPALIGVVSDRLQDEVPWDGVEGRHDTLPTSMASRRGCGSCARVMRGRAARLS
jgi:hypothetical protein